MQVERQYLVLVGQWGESATAVQLGYADLLGEPAVSGVTQPFNLAWANARNSRKADRISDEKGEATTLS